MFLSPASPWLQWFLQWLNNMERREKIILFLKKYLDCDESQHGNGVFFHVTGTESFLNHS